MAIEFREIDRVNITATRIGHDHVATIYNCKNNLHVVFDGEEELSINELEQILAKMKELQEGRK